MTDDDDARDGLRAEAERLRQEREARDRDADQTKRAAQERIAALAKSYSERRLWGSVSRFTGPLLFITIGTAALFWGISVDFEEAKNPSRVPHGLIWTSLALAVAVLVRYVVFGPWRYHRWLAALPFPVAGLTEVLGSGRAVTKATIALRFSDSAAPKDVVEELLRSKLPPPREDTPAQLTSDGSGLVIDAEFYTEVSNWPLHGWFRQLVRDVLLEVHRGWPLATVTVSVKAHDEFHTPGGPD